jgi:glycosyltransferase involved in cell wall biosynthesis
LRILIVHNFYRGALPSGESAVVEDEARLIEKSGHEVSRLFVNSDVIEKWPLLKRVTLPFRVIWSREGSHLVENAFRNDRPDVIHFHNTFPLLSPSTLWTARKTGSAVVQTLHNFRPICAAATLFRDGATCEDCLGSSPLPGLLHGCYRESRAATVPVAGMIAVHHAVGTWRRAVDLFIVPSQFARSKYIEAGWAADKFAVKYNTATVDLPPRSGPGKGFVCMSRLSPEKGIETVLQAWQEAFPDRRTTLDVIGSGPLEERLQASVVGDKSIRFHGSLDRSAAHRAVAACRGLVVNSRCYEMFPRVIAESYALGVPVVAPRIGALGELVVDGKTGIVVEPGSAAGMAEALRRLEDDPSLSEYLGATARRTFELRYAPNVNIDQLFECYERALAVSRRLGRDATVGGAAR